MSNSRFLDRIDFSVKNEHTALVDGETYIGSVQKILQKIHAEVQNGVRRPQEALEKVEIGKAEPWIVQNAKDMGVDIDGYTHEISNYFIRHVLKNHGDAEKEAKRGNLPVTDDDFERIPGIIAKPDYVVFGARRNGEDRIIYAKSTDGVTLYFEEILRGKGNRTLRGNTMYKTKKTLDAKGILANISMNGKTDVSKIKITGMDGGQTITTANQG